MPLARTADLVAAAHRAGTGVVAFNVITLEHAEAIVAGAEQAGRPVDPADQRERGEVPPRPAWPDRGRNRGGRRRGRRPRIGAPRPRRGRRRCCTPAPKPVPAQRCSTPPNSITTRTSRPRRRPRTGLANAACSSKPNSARSAERTERTRPGYAPTPPRLLPSSPPRASTRWRSPSAAPMRCRSGLPPLDFDLIARLRSAVPVPLVLHGSSGVADEDLRKAVSAGITKINVGTLLNVHFTAAVREYLARR